MAEKLDYECLPQRAPRQKRKLLLDTKPSELLAEGTGAAVHAQFVEAGTGAAEPSAAELVATTVARDPPGNGTANVQEGETNAGDLATTAPEQLAYRAAAETGQKFECGFLYKTIISRHNLIKYVITDVNECSLQT